MKLKKIPPKTKAGIIGAIALPIIYYLITSLTYSDFIILNIGFFAFPLWLIQWVSFLFGGPILVIISTIITLAITGFLIGLLINWVIKKIKSRFFTKT